MLNQTFSLLDRLKTQSLALALLSFAVWIPSPASADYLIGSCTIVDPVDPPDATRCPGQDLSGLDLSNVGSGIDLRFADFQNADLTNTDFTNSDLSFATLEGALVTGAFFTGVIWDNTICADGTNSNQYTGNGCAGTFADDDGDGVNNPSDAFPSNHAASVDTDADGFPDSWNFDCDVACQGSSGLVIDQFPGNNAAHRDDDKDGFPEAWNDGTGGTFNCNVTCQVNSGLALDAGLDDAGAIFVDVNTPTPYGSGADGLGWATAWPTIRDALAVVAEGQEIWIAKGVYYPDEVAGGETNSADDSFVLTDHVALVGGFNGDETFADAADPETNITVLSGDIEQDDANVDINGVHTGFESANLHVGTNADQIVYGLSVSARLTGLIISGGGSGGAGNVRGAGIYYVGPKLVVERTRVLYNRATNEGGGIYANNGTTTILLDEVEVDHNYGGIAGGGLYMNNGGFLEVYRSSFTNNEANGGGGINLTNGSKARIENTTIADNTANVGGGIKVHGDGVIDAPKNLDLVFSTVAYNSATVAGAGGIDISNYADVEIAGSVVVGNTAITAGSASVIRTDNDLFTAPFSSFGDAGIGGLYLEGTGPSGLVSFLTTSDPTAVIGDDPAMDIVQTTPAFLGGFTPVYPLPLNSPLKNEISEFDCKTSHVKEDQRGFERPYTQQYAGDYRCDIGAFESNDHDLDGSPDDVDNFPEEFAASTDVDSDGFPEAWTPGCISACQIASGLIIDAGLDAAGAVFVDVNTPTPYGSGANGEAWNTAWPNLEDALQDAATTPGHEIWIARGVYYPDEAGGSNSDAPGASFNLQGGINILGGFSGGESFAYQADPLNNQVILSGDIQQNDSSKVADIHTGYDLGNAHTGNNSNSVVSCSSQMDSIHIRDITITGGGGSGGTQGGGLYVYDCDLSFERGGVFYSRVEGSGGGIYFTASGSQQLNLEDILFEGNYSEGDGGGLYIQSLADETGEIQRSTFANNSVNTSGGNGGAIYIEDAKLYIENTTIANNTADSGGGIYVDSSTIISGDANLQLVMSTVAHNDATGTAGNGGGIFVGGTGDAEVDFQGTVISGNTATNNGANIYRGAADEVDADHSFVGSGSVGGLFVVGTGDTSVALFLAGGANPTVVIPTETLGSIIDNTLVDYGGLTPILAFPASSILRNAIPDYICETADVYTDQRGEPRPYMYDPGGNFGCDIGAFELNDYDLDSSPDNIDPDDDNDGMDDAWELTYLLNPFYAPDAGDDNDGDTLTNLQEFNLGRDPTFTDFAEPETDLIISPKSYRYIFEFDTATCDSVATPVTYTVHNNDTVSRDITGTITFDNVVNGTDWQIKSGTDTCSNTTLSPDTSCTFQVVFCAPNANGNHAGEINVPTDSVTTPVLTSALFNYEADHNEAERRLPPVVSELEIRNVDLGNILVTDGQIASGDMHSYTWTITGYHPTYESAVAFFNCDGTTHPNCGSNFGTNIFESGLMVPGSTAAGTWTYNGIIANTYTYTVNHTLTYNAVETNEYVLRFYRKSGQDVQTGNSSISGLIPGNIMPLRSDYYDTSGRRIIITVVP